MEKESGRQGGVQGLTGEEHHTEGREEGTAEPRVEDAASGGTT